MDPEHGDVGADHGLSHEGRQHRGVVADVTFPLGDLDLSNYLGDTLNDVIFTPGVNPFGDCWVSRCGHGPGAPGECREVATPYEWRNSTCRIRPNTKSSSRGWKRSQRSQLPIVSTGVTERTRSTTTSVSSSSRPAPSNDSLRHCGRTVTTPRRTPATWRASRTAPSSAPRTNTTPVRRTTGASRARCARFSRGSSADR